MRKLGVYERFHFADGAEGIVQKTQTLKSISKRFSLSFFDDSGFSYVVNRAGDVLVRSMHRNSNRTFQNLFDIIDLQGNDAEAVDSFRNSLANGDRGVAEFRYSGEEYVFCYVPLEDAEGWYVLSIIPNAVIMKQVNDIVSRTLWLCAVILVCLVIVGLSFYYQLKKHHKETEQLAYYDTLTGLFRYEKFRIEGEKILKREPSLTILYMDVVGFKLINDLEGYEYGDEVLNLIAEGLKKNAKEGDISCRVAGDDFVMLTTCSDKEAIEKLCGDIFLSCKEKTGKRQTFAASDRDLPQRRRWGRQRYQRTDRQGADGAAQYSRYEREEYLFLHPGDALAAFEDCGNRKGNGPCARRRGVCPLYSAEIQSRRKPRFGG